MATTIAPAGFWSYTHRDDEAEGGGIRRLADQLSSEFSLLTGDDLEIFVDRTAIAWGDQWRDRIDGALTKTTFFFPVITPRFFKSAECRKELLNFYAQAKSLGVDEYLLPILYAAVPDLTEDNSDEAIAIVARTQYVPWNELRLKEPSDPDFRAAVNAMAVRISEIANRLANSKMITPSGTASADEPKTLDLLEQVRDKWPALVELLEADRENEAKWAALWATHFDRVNRLRRSGREGAVPALVLKLAADSRPLAEFHLKAAKKYSAAAIDLNPLVISLFRLGRSGSAGINDLLQDLRADISDTCERIAQVNSVDSTSVGRYAQVSREMAQVEQLFVMGTDFVDEGNRLVADWYRLAFDREPPLSSN